MAGSSPRPLTSSSSLAAHLPAASLPPIEPVSGLRASSEMLLLVLLLPACWAVEVRRPRGVSLTSESAAGWGVGYGRGHCGSSGRHLQPLASVSLPLGREGGSAQPVDGSRGPVRLRGLFLPWAESLAHLPRPSLLRGIQAFHLPGWLGHHPF